MDSSLTDWLQQVLSWLPEGGSYLLLLFFIAFFESLSMIGLIMPGSTLAVLAGFLAAHGKSSLPLVILITSAGAFGGDLISYWLGARYGTQILSRKSFKKHRKLINRSEVFFSAHGGKSIFFARFLGPIRGITPFIAGLARMPGIDLFRYTLISALLWGLAYPGLGYLGGASWQRAESLSSRFGMLVLLVLLAMIGHYWLRRSLKLKSGENRHEH
jgi:membrane protein DedA with SNARE-associated domain